MSSTKWCHGRALLCLSEAYVVMSYRGVRFSFVSIRLTIMVVNFVKNESKSTGLSYI